MHHVEECLRAGVTSGLGGRGFSTLSPPLCPVLPLLMDLQMVLKREKAFSLRSKAQNSNATVSVTLV